MTLRSNPETQPNLDPDAVQELEQKLAESEATIARLQARLGEDSSDAASAAPGANERLQRLIERMQALVFELHPDGVTHFVNEAAPAITGYYPAELQGRNWWEIFYPGPRQAQAAELLARLEKGDVNGYETELTGRDGLPVYLELNSANHYGPQGELQRITGIANDVTQRKRVQAELVNRLAALRQVEEDLQLQNRELVRAQERSLQEHLRYQELFDFAPDGYLVSDPNAVIQEANLAAADMLQHSRDALVEKSLVTFVTPGERSKFHQFIAAVKKQPQRLEREFEFQVQGKALPVSLVVAPIIDTRSAKNQTQPPALLGLRWLLHDIRQRRQAEAEVQQTTSLLALLSEIAVAANQATSMEEALIFAIERVCEYSSYPLGHAYMLSESNPNCLEPTGLWVCSDEARYQHFQQETEKMSFRLGVGLPGEVLLSGEPAWKTGLPDNQLFIRRPLAAEAKLISALAFPVMVGDEVSAVLEFFSPRQEEPDQQSLAMMSRVGTILGRVVERERAERALRKSESRFRIVFNASPVGMMLLDLKDRVLDSNPAFERLVGLPHDRLLGRKLEDLLQQTEENQGSPTLTSSNDYKTPADTFSEQPYRIHDGRLVWVRRAFKLVKDDQDQPLFRVGAMEDVTARKRIEFELAEVQRRLLESAELERLHLAQELHDGPMQQIYGVAFQLEAVRSGLEEEARAQLESIKIDLQNIVRDLRVLAVDLRPPALAPFGLEKAIRSHAERFRAEYPDLRISLALDSDGQRMPEPVRLALFRIYQASLSNVVQHAGATQVSVRFQMDAEFLELEINDNGQGFEVPDRWVSLARQGHLGLAGAAERAEALGGRLEVNSTEGQGTSIRAVVPRDF